MRITIHKEKLGECLENQDNLTSILKVDGFAYSSNIGTGESKPTYYLFRKTSESEQIRYKKGVVLFFPTRLVEQNLIKDKTVFERLEIICLYQELKKGTYKELSKYGITISLEEETDLFTPKTFD